MKNARITFTGVSVKTVNKFTEFIEKELFTYNEQKYNLRIAISGVEIKEGAEISDYPGDFEVSFILARKYDRYLNTISDESANKLFLDLLLKITNIFNTPI